jgi:hypothetical protein
MIVVVTNISTNALRKIRQPSPDSDEILIKAFSSSIKDVHPLKMCYKYSKNFH